jgi:predicted Holliday junction resolvase-like endonuclease
MDLEVRVMLNIVLKIRILQINLRHQHHHLCLIYQKLVKNNKMLRNLSNLNNNSLKMKNKIHKFD